MQSPSKSFIHSPNATIKALSPNRRSQGTASSSSTKNGTILHRNDNEPQLNFADNIVHVHKQLKSFSAMKILQTTKSIDVQNNEIVDFKGLPSLQNLQKLNISHNPIDNLFAVPPLPALKTINCEQTPLAAQEFYRISLILAIPSLHTINGETVKPSEKRIVKLYPAECINLLRAGWVMTYPPPEQDHIIVIKRKLAKKIVKKTPKIKEAVPQSIIFHGSIDQSVFYQNHLENQRKEIEKLQDDLNKLEAKYQKHSQEYA